MSGKYAARARATHRHEEHGAAAVEFALILVPLLVLMFGILQYGWYFYSSQVGASTAREAIRRLAVGDCNTSPTLQTFVENRLGATSQGTDPVTTVYARADGTAVAAPEIGGKVTVTITFQSLDMNFPFIPVPNGAQITREVDARVEDLDSAGCA